MMMIARVHYYFISCKRIHAVSRNHWLPAELPLTTRKCVKSYFCKCFFLMRLVFTHACTHGHGFRLVWETEEDSSLSRKGRGDIRYKAYVRSFVQSVWPAGRFLTSPTERFTWKCESWRMALALSRCLRLLCSPLVSAAAAAGLFCTWQLRAGRCCVQCNWMMWYCSPSCWCQQPLLGPTHLIIFLKASERNHCSRCKTCGNCLSVQN